jgi:molybdenum cofactor cytidylyltransferase
MTTGTHTRNESTPRVHGIIPAAGRSRRMGRPKPALPIHGKPMLHHVAEPLLAAQLDSVVIVVNEEGRTLAEPLADHCEIIINPRPEAEMIESVQLAIRHIAAMRSPRDDDGLLVCPADAAGISAETVQACMDTFRNDPTRIVIAAYAGKRGHPIIFPYRLAAEVLALAPGEGLNQIARRRAGDVSELSRDDPAIARNVNTPEDYDALAP